MTDHYSQAKVWIGTVYSERDGGGDYTAGEMVQLAQANALLALTDAVRALAPKDATSARHEREDAEARQDDITEEPPVGTQVTDCEGDVWERREDGWTPWRGRTKWGPLCWRWIDLLAYGPLRLTTDEGRERVGLPASGPEPVDPDEAPAEAIFRAYNPPGAPYRARAREVPLPADRVARDDALARLKDARNRERHATDADGNALVTVRVDDLWKNLNGFHRESRDRLRRALDEREGRE